MRPTTPAVRTYDLTRSHTISHNLAFSMHALQSTCTTTAASNACARCPGRPRCTRWPPLSRPWPKRHHLVASRYCWRRPSRAAGAWAVCVCTRRTSCCLREATWRRPARPPAAPRTSHGCHSRCCSRCSPRRPLRTRTAADDGARAATCCSCALAHAARAARRRLADGDRRLASPCPGASAAAPWRCAGRRSSPCQT